MSSQKKKKITQINANTVEKGISTNSTSPEESSTDVTNAIISQEELNKEYEKELRKFIIPKLRSASYRWKYRSEAIKLARVERGRYKCAMCTNTQLKNGEYAVDHINPVVDLSGWDGNWDIYVRRMMVYTDGWQVLCHPCHTLKTDTENQIRKIRREAKKKLNE